MDGEGGPVLKGRGLSVYRIAALAENGGAEEAGRAYPSLLRKDIEAAIQYAKLYPKAGHSYPARSLKRMLSELVLPDQVFDAPSEGNGLRD